MDLPPYLTALSDLIRPFCDRESLLALHNEIEGLRSPPSPGQQAAVSTKAPGFLADELRDALGRYVVRYGPVAGWTRCQTPGCEKGWRQ